VDLEALPFIRVLDAKAAYKAADKLLRSRAFGLCVLDLVLGSREALPLPVQTRLLGLAKQSQAALLLLCERRVQDDSLGALVSLRLRSSLHACPETSTEASLGLPEPTEAAFSLVMTADKDKRLGPGWEHSRSLYGPLGLPRLARLP